MKNKDSKLNSNKQRENENAPTPISTATFGKFENSPNLKSLKPDAPIAKRAETRAKRGETPIRAKFEILAENENLGDDTPIGANSNISPIFETQIETQKPARRAASGPICRILTNIPESIPVLPDEVALLDTYWGALLDILAANDNEPN